MNVTRVYLAARYSRREELCEYRAQLEQAGFEVTSRWLNGAHQILDGQLLGEAAERLVEGESTHEDASALRERFATEDWDDLMRAHVIVAFTEPPRTEATRGGRHVEWGAALAWGLSAHAVGYRENVFYCLPQVNFHETWVECFDVLARERAWISVGATP